MKSTELAAISDRWHAGDVVWASAFAYNRPRTRLSAHQVPIKGMLLYSQYGDGVLDGARHMPARYFAPFAKGSDTDVVLSRAVSVHSRDLADTEQEALEIYNDRVRACVEWHRNQIESARSHLLPDPVGDRAPEPAIWSLTTGVSADDVLEAMRPTSEPMPNPVTRFMTWQAYLQRVHTRALGDCRDFPRLVVDGKRTQGTELDAANRLVVTDGYAVPFHAMDELFRGHVLTVYWFGEQ